jgi:AraC family transcriptional regulator
LPIANVQLIRFSWNELFHDFRTFLGEDAHRLNLALTPRPTKARACYPERWNSHRFEQLGDLMFVPAGELLRVGGAGADEGPRINCMIHAEQTRNLLGDDFVWTDRSLHAAFDIRSGTMWSLITRLGEEARYPGFASQMLAETIVVQLVIELFRHASANAHAHATGGLASWRLRVIDERLAEVCAAPTLAELAEICGLSVRQLTRAFRASCDCSIGDYVARSQIEHAKRLLRTDESIKSIAASLGFASPANFSTAFRRATGLTPREHRGELRPHPGSSSRSRCGSRSSARE